MEKTVLEQALSEAEFCAGYNSLGYPNRVAACLNRMFIDLLKPSNEKPVWKIVHTAIVDICAIFPVKIDSEDYAFNPNEVL